MKTRSRLPTPGGIPDPEDNDAITLKAPDGTPIIAVAETFPVTHSKLSGLSRAAAQNELEAEYADSGTEGPDWDHVKAIEVSGETIFMDANEKYWRESQLIQVDAPLPETCPLPLKLPTYNQALQAKVMAEQVASMVDRAIAALDPINALHAVKHMNRILAGNHDRIELLRIYNLVEQAEITQLLASETQGSVAPQPES